MPSSLIDSSKNSVVSRAASRPCMAMNWRLASTNCCPRLASLSSWPNDLSETSPAVGRCVSPWGKFCFRIPTCCCWTNPPTILTWKLFSGWKAIYWNRPSPWLSSAMTALSSIGSAIRLSPRNGASHAPTWGTTASTSNRRNSNGKPPRPPMSGSKRSWARNRLLSTASGPVPPAAPRPKAARSYWTKWSASKLRSKGRRGPVSSFPRRPVPADW